MTALAMVDLVVRVLVVSAVAYAIIVAGTHWAVRQRRLNPFGGWPRFVRKISDPALQPVERRILRSGGNPQDASLWLLGLTVAGGLLLLWLVRWVVGLLSTLSYLARSGPAAWVVALVSVAFTVMEIALIVRVVASWLGLSPESRWVRLAYRLTNWIVEPIRRVLPALGPLDFSPLVAWIVLRVAQWIVLSLLARIH